MSSEVRIDEEIRNRFGSVKIAFLIARNITITATPPREKKIARRVEAELRDALTVPTLNTDPIIASWFDLARRMGISDDADLPAQVQLMRRILSGHDIPKINNVVDAANITAAQFRCPVGAFDLDKLQPGITLRIARPGEVIRPLFATDDVPIPEGEIVYADSELVFSRYSKDADQTKITDLTKNIFCVVDGTPETSVEHITRARDSLASLLLDVGGDIEIERGVVVA